jgi:pimeloyl-ACP methyl ester carboxylesterase
MIKRMHFFGVVAIGLLASATGAMAADAPPVPTMVTLSTGSRLATWTLPATAKPRKTAVLFLHGGPGMYTTEGFRGKGAVLRAAGFTTIYFDQAGGGLSDRIPATQYTLMRAVDDVEALRTALKLDKMILWGSSYGADLAALYARRFPEHVAAMILTSPGSFPGTAAKRDYSRTDRGKSNLSATASKAIRLIDSKGGGAEAELSQTVAGQLMDEVVSTELMNGMVCKGSASPPPVVAGGGNLYANRMLSRDLKKTPLPAGAPLAGPVLILRGACDFLPMDSAERYRTAFGGTIMSIANTGHQFIENRADLDAALSNFATKELAGIE